MRKNIQLITSIIMGIIFGISVYNYWLIDILPPASKRILIFTFLACLGGVFGYFILIKFWIFPRFEKLIKAQKWHFIWVSIFVGSILMLAGTNAWQSSSRYFRPFLPTSSLEISASPPENNKAPEVTILWISSALGDVSLETLTYQGWERKGNQIILTNPLDNVLKWEGATGANAFILFRKSPQAGKVNISWNGENEVVDLFSESKGDYVYEHSFQIPFYASTMFSFLLALLNFVFIGGAVHLLFIEKKEAAIEIINKTILTLPPSMRIGDIKNKQDDKILFEYTPIFICILLAFALRVFNLDNLYPYADEYLHLLAAKELLNGAALGDVYQRGLYIVTLPITASFSLLGATVWAARLPGVILNSLAIIPLYLITRKINKPIALISCILYATSPYIISFARNVREYAYYPFYFYLIILGAIAILRDFPNKFVILWDWRKIPSNIYLFSAIFVFSVIYAIFIDPISTFKMVLVIYGVLSIFLIEKFDIKDKGNLYILSAFGFFIVISLFFVIHAFMETNSLSVSLRFLQYFFGNPQQQWYYNRPIFVLLPGLIYGTFLSFAMRRVNFIPSFLYSLFFFFCVFFALLFNATGYNMHPRFLMTAQLWFVPIIALSLYYTWVYLGLFFQKNKRGALLASSLIVILIINPSQVLLPTFFRGEYMPITELIHDDLSDAQEYMILNAKEEDVLISSVYAGYSEWQGLPKFKAIYSYTLTSFNLNKTNPKDYVFAAIEANKSGWIVIDDLRYGITKQPIPKKSFVIQNKQVEYVGQFESQYIWRWVTIE